MKKDNKKIYDLDIIGHFSSSLLISTQITSFQKQSIELIKINEEEKYKEKIRQALKLVGKSNSDLDAEIGFNNLKQFANAESKISHIEPFNERTREWSKKRQWKKRLKNLQNSIK